MVVKGEKCAMKLTPARDGNRLSISPGKKAETCTLDVEQLDDVTFYVGIAPGEPLIRERSKKHKPLPKFTSETLLIEVPALLAGTYRPQTGIGTFSITSSNHDRFLGKDGIRFTYDYMYANIQQLKVKAWNTLIKGLTYL